jgi:hypothetical protein
MDFTAVDTAVYTRATVRVKDTNGWAAGRTGIAMGYNASYDTVKIGFVDVDGMYTGDSTRVPRTMVELVTEEETTAGTPETTEEVTVGSGASFVYGSDREPGTIVRVDLFKSGPRTGQPRRIHVQYDRWTMVSGNFQANNAVIEYTADPTAPVVQFTQRADGRWVNSKGSRVVVGTREYYQNPHF